jgi:uncharacterized protein YndB with AHSA1/START domain
MNNPIVIHTVVQADAASAWNYYTSPEHITGWNFASPDWCCPRAEVDLQPSGRYVARMEATDGSMGFDFEVVFSAVEPHQHLAYTMADGRKATIDFEPVESGTRVTVAFETETMHSRELQEQGWQAILNNYGAYVARNN